ncbi:MAG TPA: amino acid ABC transporter substrate-binding protein [Desulfobacteraceae bacterium]|nr:amino acid ABC transporter substrate-binding protein [Desulfobacteraceae bacterium]|tara:strand:- start:266 stop:1051 length:786 start_codon:yes stop_codon:yes gene_type:complete
MKPFASAKRAIQALFILSSLILIPATPCHAGGKVITAASDPWPPFVDPGQPKEGLSMEIIRAAYATQGYTVTLIYVPWARAEDGVKRGTYDILPPTWKTEKRQTYFMYSVPYAVNQLKFIMPIDDPFEYKGLNSLKGKIVGTVRGYGYDDAFLKAKDFTRVETNNFISNIKKLLHPSRRIDLTVEDEIVARVRIAAENPDLLSQIRFSRNNLSTNPLHVAAGLAHPRHKELIIAFNKGLAAIKANGVYTGIMQNFGLEPRP